MRNPPVTRQVNFWIGKEDQYIVEDAIARCGEFVVFYTNSNQGGPTYLEDTVIQEFNGDSIFIAICPRGVWFDFQAYLGESEDGFFYNPAYMPGIEFTRCYVSEVHIQRGRLYVNNTVESEEGELEYRNPELIAWADCVFRRVKSKLVHIGGGDYAGPEALALRERGIKFAA